MTMQNEIEYLFRYIEKEDIVIDKNEFLFQTQSHPDYPSLLSTTDTLNFFSIENIAFNHDFKEVETLPEKFIVFLKVEKHKPMPFFIEKKKGKYFIYENRKQTEINLSSLEARWHNTILLIKNSQTEIKINKGNKSSFTFGLLALPLFIFILVLFEINFFKGAFFLFPLVGILFSIASLKDLFGTKSQIINNLCNFSSATNCDEVIKSNQWKIFKYINFSDLSIVFFTIQITALFIMLLAGLSNDYFSIQFYLTILSLPVIILSIYYQKNIVKKWCPICLIISSVIVLETIYFFCLNLASFNIISMKAIFAFSFISFLTLGLWSSLKKTLLLQKELKEFRLKSNRFQRNYKNFKTILLSGKKENIQSTPIILGSKNSKINISIITNPFCGHCEKIHENIKKILLNYENNIQINIVLKVEMETEEENSKSFFRNLIGGYLNNGGLFYIKAMDDWYALKKVDEWNKKYNIKTNTTEIDQLLHVKNEWCVSNNHNYTPAIFINGYEYPDTYERDNLEFFISELIEDVI